MGSAKSFGKPKGANEMSYGSSISRTELETFKASWPCHGIPDNVWRLWFEFGSNGDLMDLRAFARNGRRINTESFDTPALLALCEGAQRKCHPEHADIRYGRN